MTEVIPFRGIHYNREKVAGEVMAPPYDIISPAMRDSLYAQSPYNVVRIDFGMESPGDSDEDNKYTRASAFLNTWLQKDVLIQSEKPCFYAYRMGFELDGKECSLTGIFGLVRLVELGQGVFPHEATHSKPKKDRLSLMTESCANTSPIYSLYRSRKGTSIKEGIARTTSSAPYLEAAAPDGTRHALWIIDDETSVAGITEGLRDVNIFIADGHHRYETALEYQRIQSAEGPSDSPAPHDYVLMFLADIDDPGLAVLPTHRAVTVDTDSLTERLSEKFEIEELPPETNLRTAIEGVKQTFGIYANGKKYKIHCKDCGLEEVEDELKDLDVVLLHKLIFGKLLEVGNWGYEMDYETTMAMVDDGEYDAAFVLNPTAVTDVERVAMAGLRMPPKSTYFYPKVQTGFIINTLKSR